MGRFSLSENQAALEFECFRMLSYGYAVSIGDQLEPYGVLNPAAYQLIGKVFHQLKEREAWARPSKALVEAALVTSEPIPCEHQIPESVFGAVQLLEELALQFDVVDLEAPLDQYSLVILPDDLAVTPEYQRKLNDYAAKGGKSSPAPKEDSIRKMLIRTALALPTRERKIYGPASFCQEGLWRKDLRKTTSM